MAYMSTAFDKKVLVCANFRANPNHPSCGARGSDKIFTALSELLHDLPIKVEKSPCMGLCHDGPNVRLAPRGRFFNDVDMQTLELLTKEIKAFIAC